MEAVVVPKIEIEMVFVDNKEKDKKLPDVIVQAKVFPPKPSIHFEEKPDIHESYFSIAIQVFIPFIIAGFGTVGAGLIFDDVQHWDVYENIPELVTLVPALLGLKGNLEMTLSSRLSTLANLGKMDTFQETWKIISANMVLIQCQANVVGFIGSSLAFIFGAAKTNRVNFDNAFLLCASSLITASFASLILGAITSLVIVASKKCHINPDNVAVPIAASLGDITSLIFLSTVSKYFYANKKLDRMESLPSIIIVIYIIITPLWCWIAKRNANTKDVLYHGWTPVILAMFISLSAGLILNFMVARYEEIAVYTPVINGVGGNLVAVQASRISTSLHKKAEMRDKGSATEIDDTVIFITPLANFFGKSIHSKTNRVLMAMVVPGHLIFIHVIVYILKGEVHTTSTIPFKVLYLFAALVQVGVLLHIAYILVHWMWSKKIDPDNSAIPYLTSLADVTGICLLGITFHLLYLMR